MKPDTTDKSTDDIKSYYRYRRAPIDGQYGDNRSAAAKEDAIPSDSGSADTQNSDDSTSLNVNDSDDDTAGNAAQGSSPLADAILNLVSSWANDIVSTYGLKTKMSQVVSLLGQMR